MNPSHKFRVVGRFVVGGVLFGLMFPFVATTVDFALQGGAGWADVLSLQARQPLHWIIDTAPLVLGAFAYFIGRRQVVAEELAWELGQQRNQAQLEEALISVEAGQASLNRLNAELAARATLQEAILDSTNLSIISTDPTGLIKTFNAGAERMLGYQADELVGRETPGLIHEPDEVVRRAAELSAELGREVPPGFEVFVTKPRSEGVEEREWTYVCKDGTKLPVFLSVTRLSGPAGEVEGFLGVAVDLSERKAAALEQREREVRLQAVLDTMMEGLITFSEDGVIESLNQVAVELFGYSSQELVGRNVKVLMPEPHAGERDGYLASFQETGAAKAIGQRREVEGRRKDGQSFPLELSVGRLELSDRLLFTGVVRDITARKRVDRLKNEFVSTVSHELRTPLTSIRGSLGLLEAGVAGELNPEAGQLVSIARTNADRLIRLVNDILDLDKIAAGKLILRRVQIESGALVEAAVENLSGFAAEADVRLVVEETGGGELEGDRDRLIQVLVNLLSNAIKFEPAGGVVRVRSAAREDRIRFTIEDHGPGIAPADMPLLFQKFQQLDGSDARAQGGSGLGLSIAKAIVEQHGGTIGVESRPGEGSSFHFELPLSAGVAAEPLAAPLKAGPEPHLLLVEDDRDVATVLSMQLAAEGFRISFAPSLREARAQLSADPPRAILLDLNLPDGCGLELLKDLQGQPHPIPVIVVTGQLEEDHPGHACPILVDWLAKPIDGERLRQALHQALRRPGQGRAVIVDDDAGARAVLKAQLASQGLECFEAEGGAQALALIQEVDPDFVVLDVDMPHMDGYGLVERLRERNLDRLPAIIYTGLDLDDTARGRLELGLTRYLTKARTSEEQFLSVVREFLRTHVTGRAGA